MTSVRLMLLAVAAACLVACDRESTGPVTESREATVASANATPTLATPQTDTGKDAMHALQNVVLAYLTPPAPAWDAFGKITGVAWDSDVVQNNPDAKPENAYFRSGTLTLAGFGDTDLPNGKVGPEADYIRGNEGRSGITLNGTQDSVNSIAVQKFYPDQDYAKVLEAQFGPGSVHPLTRPCKLADDTSTGEANFARNTFFRITLPGGLETYAEGSVDEEGGKYTPGSTTYFFYRSEPTKRIGSMQCEHI